MARPGRTVFVDVNPLADKHLTGIGRYTARLALAVAARPGDHGAVRLARSRGDRPAGLDWSQDQDLGRWGRQVWRGRAFRWPGRDPPDSLAVFAACARRAAVPVRGQRPARLHHAGRAADPLREDPRRFRRFLRRACSRATPRWPSRTRPSPTPTGSATSHPSRSPSRLPGRASASSSISTDRPSQRRPEVGLVVSTIEPRKNAVFLLEWFRQTDALPEGSELWWVGRSAG